jgi:hypothetical protein
MHNNLWLYGFVPSYTQHSLVLLNKFSLIIPCHILLLFWIYFEYILNILFWIWHSIIKLNLFSDTSECCLYDGTKPYNRYEPQKDTNNPIPNNNLCLKLFFFVLCHGLNRTVIKLHCFRSWILRLSSGKGEQERLPSYWAPGFLPSSPILLTRKPK